MNVRLPKKEKINIKAIIIYTISIVACIIAVIVIACAQYFGSEELDKMIAIGATKATNANIDTQILKVEFNSVFDNKLNKNTETNIKKLQEDKDIIFTNYEKKENKVNNYDIDLNIPKINMDNDIINKYNEEIEKTFIQKAENVLTTENMNIIYTVQYTATIEEDMLSLVIRSNLKEGASAQRVIVLTYNYDLKTNKEISLEELINKKNLNKADIEKKVEQEISFEQAKVQDLKSLGYSIFERNLKDERYKIENTKEFFIKDERVYLIYAYGNDNITSEMDLVVI